jgi:hypothetical protein
MRSHRERETLRLALEIAAQASAQLLTIERSRRGIQGRSSSGMALKWLSASRHRAIIAPDATSSRRRAACLTNNRSIKDGLYG